MTSYEDFKMVLKTAAQKWDDEKTKTDREALRALLEKWGLPMPDVEVKYDDKHALTWFRFGKADVRVLYETTLSVSCRIRYGRTSWIEWNTFADSPNQFLRALNEADSYEPTYKTIFGNTKERRHWFG